MNNKRKKKEYRSIKKARPRSGRKVVSTSLSLYKEQEERLRQLEPEEYRLLIDEALRHNTIDMSFVILQDNIDHYERKRLQIEKKRLAWIQKIGDGDEYTGWFKMYGAETDNKYTIYGKTKNPKDTAEAIEYRALLKGYDDTLTGIDRQLQQWKAERDRR